MTNVTKIAKEAGVSLATASRVLRSPHRLRTENQKRVIEAANRLGYRIDAKPAGATCQILFLSFSNVLPAKTFFDSLYSLVIDGVSRVMAPHGYSLLVHHVERDMVLPQCLVRGEVDGVIFHGNMEKSFYDCYIAGIPAVNLQYLNPMLDCSCVKIDNFDLAFQAVRYLVERGHKRIGFVNDESEYQLPRERLAGYRDAMAYYHLPIRPEWEAVWQRPLVNGELTIADPSDPTHCAPIAMALHSPEPVTAFYCADNWRAELAARTAEQLGIRVPEDLSLIGSATFPCSCTYTSKRFTCFDDRFGEVCSEAAKLLLDLIEHRCTGQLNVQIRPKLIEGETVTPLVFSRKASSL